MFKIVGTNEEFSTVELAMAAAETMARASETGKKGKPREEFTVVNGDDGTPVYSTGGYAVDRE